MNKVTNFIVFGILCLCASCGSDDTCTTASVSGAYNFVSIECTPMLDMDAESGTIADADVLTVTAIDENTISIEGEEGTAFEVVLTDCTIGSEPIVLDLFGIILTTTYSGEFNGDQLTLNITSELGGGFLGEEPLEEEKSTCTLIGSR